MGNKLTEKIRNKYIINGGNINDKESWLRFYKKEWTSIYQKIPEVREIRRKQQSICAYNRRDKHYVYMKEYANKNPWVKTYKSITSRISSNPYYKNIKRKLGFNDLKIMWFRDKAYKLIRPSIDRINPDGDYTMDNCRYIEFNLNSSRR